MNLQRIREPLDRVRRGLQDHSWAHRSTSQDLEQGRETSSPSVLQNKQRSTPQPDPGLVPGTSVQREQAEGAGTDYVELQAIQATERDEAETPRQRTDGTTSNTAIPEASTSGENPQTPARDPWKIGPIPITTDRLFEVRPNIFVSGNPQHVVPEEARLVFQQDVEENLNRQLEMIKYKLPAKPKKQYAAHNPVYYPPELRMSGEAEEGMVVLSPTIWIPAGEHCVGKLEKWLKEGSLQWAHENGFGRVMVGSSRSL